MFGIVPNCAASSTVCCSLLASLLFGCAAAESRSRPHDASPPDAAARDAAALRDARLPDVQLPDAAPPSVRACSLADNSLGPRLNAWLFESLAPGAQPQAVSLVQALTINGVVQAHGDGFPMFAAPPGFKAPTLAGSYRYLRIADGSRERTLVVNGLPDWGVREGTAIQLRLSSRLALSQTFQSTLLIEAGAELGLFYGTAPDVTGLSSPAGFGFRRAGLVCQTMNRCGAVGSYQLGVASRQGAELLLAPNETREAGELRFTHGGTHAGLGSSSSCLDYEPNTTQLTISRIAPIASPAFACESSEASTLPGVHIRFGTDTRCTYSLAEVSAGIRVPYTVDVAQDVQGFASEALDIGGCGIPSAGEFGTFEELAGAGQHYALNDIGGCFGQPLRPGTLRKGTYSHSFTWDGRNWSGPSDTGNAKGERFPPGIYTLTIRAKGYVGLQDADAGDGTPFEASATLRLLLTE